MRVYFVFIEKVYFNYTTFSQLYMQIFGVCQLPPWKWNIYATYTTKIYFGVIWIYVKYIWNIYQIYVKLYFEYTTFGRNIFYTLWHISYIYIFSIFFMWLGQSRNRKKIIRNAIVDKLRIIILYIIYVS